MIQFNLTNIFQMGWNHQLDDNFESEPLLFDRRVASLNWGYCGYCWLQIVQNFIQVYGWCMDRFGSVHKVSTM